MNDSRESRRFLPDTTEEEARLADWLAGSGQMTLGALAFVFIAVAVFKLVFG